MSYAEKNYIHRRNIDNDTQRRKDKWLAKFPLPSASCGRVLHSSGLTSVAYFVAALLTSQLHTVKAQMFSPFGP